MTEFNHDSEWLHKMAEAEDGADCSVGSPAPKLSLQEFEQTLKKLEEKFPVDMGIAPTEGDEIFTPDVPEVFKEPNEKGQNELGLAKESEAQEQKKPVVIELTADQKQLLMNRVKRMQKKAQKAGKLHTGKPGDIIQMSDRHYAVANDGSFRFVRML